MPAAFDACRAGGGKIRTVKPNSSTYIHVCVDKGGKTHVGEVKHVKGAWDGESDPPGEPEKCDFYDTLESGTEEPD